VTEVKNWRLIENAPHDGTKILAFYDSESDPYYSGENGKLTDYAANAEGGDFLCGRGICVAIWQDQYFETINEYGDGYWVPGCWFAWFNGDAEFAIAATHWIPLLEYPT
jgi:hypothetical protein